MGVRVEGMASYNPLLKDEQKHNDRDDPWALDGDGSGDREGGGVPASSGSAHAARWGGASEGESDACAECDPCCWSGSLRAHTTLW